MDCLELEATVEEVQPFWTGDVESGAELALREGFGWPEIVRAGSPVRECDLNLKR